MSDLVRLGGIRERTNCCPLGVGALAGNPFGIDRAFLTKDLDFSSTYPNGLAAVADRDVVAEILQWSSLLMVHLSRLSEDLAIYSTAEFGFVRVADSYNTGSSLMPQKKNPDSLELIRGKAGRVMGQVRSFSSPTHIYESELTDFRQVSGFLSTLKSLPTSYNKDLQESVEPLIDCVKTVSHCVRISAGVLSTLQIDSEKRTAYGGTSRSSVLEQISVIEADLARN